MYSEISKDAESKEEIAKKLCDRCNELGKMELSAIYPEETAEEITEAANIPEEAEVKEAI